MTDVDGLIAQIHHIRDELTCEVGVKGQPCGRPAECAFRWGCSCIILSCADHRAYVRGIDEKNQGLSCETHRMTRTTIATIFKL